MSSILVVEDDEAIRNAVRRGLTRARARRRHRGHGHVRAGAAARAHPRPGAGRPRPAGRRRPRADRDDPGGVHGPDHRDHRPRRRPDHRAGPRRGRRRLRHQAVRHRAAGRPDPRRAAPRRRARAGPTSRSGSATWSSTSAPARPPSTGQPLELARKEFDLLLALAVAGRRGRHQEGAARRRVAAGVRRLRALRRRPRLVAAAQARRDRGRAALPPCRPRCRDPPGRPRDA